MGGLTYMVAATKSGVRFLTSLVALTAAYTGRQIRLICDNGRLHATKAMGPWLEANRDRIGVYWLPPFY